MNSIEKLAVHTKAYGRLLKTIGENRFELLAVELQEDLHRLMCIIMLMLCLAVFGLLAGMTLTAALVLVLNYPPVTVLLSVTGFYIAAGVLAYWRIARLLGRWQLISASIRQLRKDLQCRANQVA